MINLRRVVTNPNFTSRFTVYRKSGQWTIKGKFEQTETSFNASGVVTIAKGTDLNMIPEGDRVGGEILISSITKLYPTKSDGTSDEILWNGERYRVYSAKDDSRWGFYKAICQRIGD